MLLFFQISNLFYKWYNLIFNSYFIILLLNLIEFMSRVNLGEKCLGLLCIYVYSLKYKIYVNEVSSILHLEAHLPMKFDRSHYCL